MFCPNCGTQIEDNTAFCPTCGTPLKKKTDAAQPATMAGDDPGVDSANNNGNKARKKNAKKKWFIIGGVTVILIIVACLMASPSGSTSVERNIQTVQTGYLGEYTDITVQELFDGYYQTMLGCEAAWDGGETEEGKQIVQVTYSSADMDDTTIQFTMLNDQVFEVTAFVDPLLTIEQATDLPAELNYIYLLLYTSQHESEVGNANFEQALVDRLDQISGSAVLYGASADYTGDRSELCTLFGDSPLEVSVPWMLDAYGYFDMSYYMNDISAPAETEETTDDDYIFPSDRQYITEADMTGWDQNTALLARNEIYARHGYVFQTQEIQNYFAAKDWYTPNPSYDGSGLSDVEKANVDAILAYEQKNGWAIPTASLETQAQQAVESYLSTQGISYTGIDYVRARSEGGYQVCVKQLESGNEYEVVYVVQFNNDIATVVGTETWGTFEPF